MNMNELITALTSLQSSLRANKQINVIGNKFNARLPKEYHIVAFEENLPEYKSIAELYTIFSNDGLVWYSKVDGTDSIGGEFHFGSIDSTSESLLEMERPQFYLSQSIGFLKDDSFAILDSHPHAGDGVHFILRFIPGKEKIEDIEIWGHETQSDAMYKLSLTVPQYILAMCHFKCLYLWQWLFVVDEHKGRLDEKWYKDLLHSLEILKSYFPELDINKRSF
jgi:hypothetical protein